MDHLNFIEKISGDFANYCDSHGITGLQNRSALMRMLFDTVSASPAPAVELSYISSPNAVIEVIDEESGALFRRYLELDYSENDNGIRLLGENMAGEESSIVFLSGTAIEKISDLQGQGRDNPRCK